MSTDVNDVRIAALKQMVSSRTGQYCRICLAFQGRGFTPVSRQVLAAFQGDRQVRQYSFTCPGGAVILAVGKVAFSSPDEATIETSAVIVDSSQHPEGASCLRKVLRKDGAWVVTEPCVGGAVW